MGLKASKNTATTKTKVWKKNLHLCKFHIFLFIFFSTIFRFRAHLEIIKNNNHNNNILTYICDISVYFIHIHIYRI